MTSEVVLPLAMVVLLIAGILTGYPVALVLGGSAMLTLLVSSLPMAFDNILISRIYGNILTNWLFLSIPMFISMGLFLERSGIAARSLSGIQQLLGNRRGGLGIAVVGVGALMAAATGVVGASVVMLTLLALPEMRRLGYANDLSAGVIASSGTLAILMPPSIMLIVLSDQLTVPVGALFAASIVPSAALVVAYVLYVALRARFLPAHAPAADLREKVNLALLVLGIAPLVILIVCVLGAIIEGIATPTEASGVGALGAMLLVALHGKLTGGLLRTVAVETLRNTAIILFLAIGATCFSAVFRGAGGEDLIVGALEHAGAGAWGTLGILMLTMFVLGFFLDWLEITLVLMPIFGPIVAGLEFGNGLAGTQLLTWFAVLVAVNLQTSFITPPFGFSLFYMRAAAAEGLSNRETYLGIIPFVLIQLTVLGLIMLAPHLLLL